MENDYDISSTSRQQEDLDKCDSSVNALEGEGEEDEEEGEGEGEGEVEEEEEEEDDDEDHGMEVDLGDVEANEAGTESLAELADSYSASGIAQDVTSVDKNVESSAVSSKSETQCKKDESMDVDARSNASDIECLGDEDEEEEEEEVAAEVAPGSEQKETAASGKPDSSLDNSDVKICEENGSLGSPDIEEITDGGKSNGHDSSSDSLKDTPKKKNKKAVLPSVSITPRRSSRNINRKSYLEREMGYLGNKVISAYFTLINPLFSMSLTRLRFSEASVCSLNSCMVFDILKFALFIFGCILNFFILFQESPVYHPFPLKRPFGTKLQKSLVLL